MNRKIKLLAVLLVFVMQASAAITANNYKINIDVKGLPENCQVFLKDFESTTDINKGNLVNGKGILEGNLETTPRVLFLTIFDGSKTYWCNLMIANEEVSINASTNDFPFHVRVKGSPVNDVFYALNSKLADDRQLRDSLFTKAKSIMTDAALRTELKRLVREMAIIDSAEITTKKEFVESNLQTYPAVMELFLIRSSYQKEELASLYLQLADDLKTYSYGAKLKDYLGIAKIVAKGDKAFSFTAIDKEGAQHLFPKANGGKYMLLDFTKDYCAPCIQSVKEIKSLSTKYHDSLEVVSFSPDEKQSWLKGLARDQPNWLCLWDGKGSAGPVVLNYGVQAYPTFLLVDPAGVVVAKTVGYSEGTLQALLKPFLKL